MITIFKPDYIYKEDKFEKGYGVAVEDGKIVDVALYGSLAAKYKEAVRNDWPGLVMVPGTVNVHNHCFQSILRGLSCDRPFLEWRDNALYKYSDRFKKEHIYGGAVFAFGEMMKYGVTTVSDFFYLHNFGTESDEMIIQAAKDVGIRLVLARTMYDWQGAPKGYVETIEQAVEHTEYLAKKYNGKDGMVKVIPAPHSPHAATPEMIQAGHGLAKKLGTGFHIHVAEEPFEVKQVMEETGGLRTVEFLDKLGVADKTMTIIHGVWLEAHEIELLGEKGASLAYCPSSNMFLADGITDIPKMMAGKVLIGLGSDGACSNNRISIFEEMRMVSLLQKAKTCDAMCLNYKDAFDMGTRNGGKLLGLPVGEIKAGFHADFVGIKLEDLSMQPLSESCEQMLPNIVYSMQPAAIEKVVVNGKTTVDGGAVRTIPEAEILAKVKEIMKEIGA